MEVSGQFLGPVALRQGKEPPVSIGWKAGWAPEHVWTLLLLPETEAGFLSHPAGSLLLYQLKYPKWKNVTSLDTKFYRCNKISNLNL
jgi:hypothetical protein